jgi:hypothetical protein
VSCQATNRAPTGPCTPLSAFGVCELSFGEKRSPREAFLSTTWTTRCHAGATSLNSLDHVGR